MELKDLEGVQALDAVDYGPVRGMCEGPISGSPNMLRMRLCGVIYVCEEDPSDGYRSSMEELRIDDPKTHPIQNEFGHVLVRCELDPQENDILRVYDIANNKLVLEVGTDHTDSYYPTYVANWNPENLHINEGVKS